MSLRLTTARRGANNRAAATQGHFRAAAAAGGGGSQSRFIFPFQRRRSSPALVGLLVSARGRTTRANVASCHFMLMLDSRRSGRPGAEEGQESTRRAWPGCGPPTLPESARRVSTSFPLGTTSRLHNADGHRRRRSGHAPHRRPRQRVSANIRRTDRRRSMKSLARRRTRLKSIRPRTTGCAKVNHHRRPAGSAGDDLY